jgi:type II secretory pathway component PulM
MSMKEAQEKAKVWWSQLGQREQRMLSIGAIAVAFFILYAGIWMPIQDHLADMRVSIGKDQKTLQWMQSADKEISHLEGQSKQQKKSVTPVELLSIVQQTVEEAELSSSLTSSKQASGDSIVLHFQKTDFDRLMAMLIITLKEQNVTVTQFSATAANAPGVVNADVTLKIG